jgi:hypothetical protein
MAATLKGIDPGSGQHRFLALVGLVKLKMGKQDD